MGYSHQIEDLFFNLQATLRPTFSIEVGAYDASFSKELKKVHPSINAYAFEASEVNYRKFEGDLNRAWNVNYVYCAMSDHVGETSFFYQADAQEDAPNNSVLPRNGSNLREEIVPCTTLDRFFMDSGLMSPSDTACLWVDVEGATGLVLPSAQKLLAQTTSILVEVEYQQVWQGQWLAEDVKRFLESNGFAFLARDREYFPLQENYLFVRE